MKLSYSLNGIPVMSIHKLQDPKYATYCLRFFDAKGADHLFVFTEDEFTDILGLLTQARASKAGPQARGKL